MSRDEIDFRDLDYDEGEVSDNTKADTTSPAPPIFKVTLDSEIGGWIEYDHETGEPIGRGGTIADAIIAQTVHKLKGILLKDVEKLVREVLGDEIQSQVSELVREIIAAPVQLTNRFGERTGKETSVREHIAEEVKEQLTRRQDTYDRKSSVLTQVIKTEVEQALAKELREAVTDARNVVVGAVKNQTAAILAKALKEGLRD